MNRHPLLLALALVAALLGESAVHAAPTSVLSATDRSEIAVSYTHLTTDFYQKVSPQSVLDSVRGDLISTLRSAGLKHATLPVLRANGLEGSNVHAIESEIAAAARAGAHRVPLHQLAYAAIDGMMRSVHDRYTVFLTPKEFAELNQGLDGGNFGGIGIVIQQDDRTHYIAVENVIPNGPADKAGIEQDDLIVSIDGAQTKSMTPQQASSHLRGREGTHVSLTIQRDGKVLAQPIVITRAKIHDVSVFEKMLPNKIGYVELTVFGLDTGSELADALNRLEQEGVRAIVLDLRDNGGGYLDAAIAVSSKFISSGPIVSVEERHADVTTWEADNTAISPLPLAVLVNGHTASASEITSGAIQDSGVGTIIGTRTFGKGVVQTIYPLGDGSAIKITTARYLTPHNRDINHLGISPDITVSENQHPRYGDPPHDVQLQRALEFLQNRLAQLNAENS
ncbi:MAG: S41 family peptidase [Candidatus Tyrphobacter sp.]